MNSKHIRRLMRLMRLMPIYQKPNTSKSAKGHKTYPYLFGSLRVERPNLVWCAEITDLPMRRGFLYLIAITDWFSRKVLAWRISNTLEADFFVEALNEACQSARNLDPLNLLVDSTGIKFLGDGEWQARKHGVQGRRQLRKVHLAMDPTTSDIRAVSASLPPVVPYAL